MGFWDLFGSGPVSVELWENDAHSLADAQRDAAKVYNALPPYVDVTEAAMAIAADLRGVYVLKQVKVERDNRTGTVDLDEYQNMKMVVGRPQRSGGSETCQADVLALQTELGEVRAREREVRAAAENPEAARKTAVRLKATRREREALDTEVGQAVIQRDKLIDNIATGRKLEGAAIAARDKAIRERTGEEAARQRAHTARLSAAAAGAETQKATRAAIEKLVEVRGQRGEAEAATHDMLAEVADAEERRAEAEAATLDMLAEEADAEERRDAVIQARDAEERTRRAISYDIATAMRTAERTQRQAEEALAAKDAAIRAKDAAEAEQRRVNTERDDTKERLQGEINRLAAAMQKHAGVKQDTTAILGEKGVAEAMRDAALQEGEAQRVATEADIQKAVEAQREKEAAQEGAAGARQEVADAMLEGAQHHIALKRAVVRKDEAEAAQQEAEVRLEASRRDREALGTEVGQAEIQRDKLIGNIATGRKLEGAANAARDAAIAERNAAIAEREGEEAAKDAAIRERTGEEAARQRAHTARLSAAAAGDETEKATRAAIQKLVEVRGQRAEAEAATHDMLAEQADAEERRDAQRVATEADIQNAVEAQRELQAANQGAVGARQEATDAEYQHGQSVLAAGRAVLAKQEAEAAQQEAEGARALAASQRSDIDTGITAATVERTDAEARLRQIAEAITDANIQRSEAGALLTTRTQEAEETQRGLITRTQEAERTLAGVEAQLSAAQASADATLQELGEQQARYSLDAQRIAATRDAVGPAFREGMRKTLAIGDARMEAAAAARLEAAATPGTA